MKPRLQEGILGRKSFQEKSALPLPPPGKIPPVIPPLPERTAAMKERRENFFARFFRMEAAGGILLGAGAAAALLLANTPLRNLYQGLVQTPLVVKAGSLGISKPLLLWVNDGLMAVFFLLVGLELKREYKEGELSRPRNLVLPALGALGGMLLPALVYLAFNPAGGAALKGWAIPTATDIAFALGILSLLGPRVPPGLKIFLTSLAIFDDLGAIVIIALFYTAKVSLPALAVTGACLLCLGILNKAGVTRKSPYLLAGLAMWVALLKSGVHATLAGVALALFIPMRDPRAPEVSPLKALESDLHPAVAFFILPVFAFFNAGIDFRGIGSAQWLHGITLGIAAGLFLGKQAGIMLFSWLGIRLGWAELPEGAGWGGLWGAALLCGVGFTMSLFIGTLAFEEAGMGFPVDERLGIVLGSLVSGLSGFFLLRRFLGPPRV